MKLLSLVLAGGLCGACGGDGRAPTAPPLPQPILDAPCSEYDVGADGTIDIVYQFTYDDDGFLTRFEGTPGPDIGESTYDANHFLLTFTQQYDADPEPELADTYTRDREGRVLTYQGRDESGTTSSTYTYDAEGRLTGAVLTDTQGNRAEYTYVYTGDDLVPTSGRLTYGSGASSFTYMSSDGERTVHVDIDDGEDGTIERTTDTRYDDDRRVVELVSRAGGQLTQRDERVYSDRGNLILRTVSGTESGPADYVFTSVLDTRGLQIERSVASPSGVNAGSVYREVDRDQCDTVP